MKIMKLGRWIALAFLALLCNTLFFLVVPLLDTFFTSLPKKTEKVHEATTEVEFKHREPPKEMPKKVMRNMMQDLKTFRVASAAPGQSKGFQMDLSLANAGDGDGVAVGGSGLANMVYDPSEVDEEARVVKEVNPIFPPRASKEGVTGFVKLYLVIDANGNVGEVQVLSVEPMGYGFETEAIKAIRQFKFAPAKIKTVPVAQKATKEFVFDLGY